MIAFVQAGRKALRRSGFGIPGQGVWRQTTERRKVATNVLVPVFADEGEKK